MLQLLRGQGVAHTPTTDSRVRWVGQGFSTSGDLLGYLQGSLSLVMELLETIFVFTVISSSMPRLDPWVANSKSEAFPGDRTTIFECCFSMTFCSSPYLAFLFRIHPNFSTSVLRGSAYIQIQNTNKANSRALLSGVSNLPWHSISVVETASHCVSMLSFNHLK